MAAAEYFSNAPLSQPASQPYQQQQQTQTPPPSYNPPHIQTPPQYQQQNGQNHGANLAPPPAQPHQRHSFSGQQRPSFSQTGWNQPPTSNPYEQQNQMLALHHPPQNFSSPHSSGYNSPHQRPQHLTPHMRPYANPNSSQFSLESGYSSDPEPHRRKQKNRKRSGSDHKSSRSTNTDAFLGAAGGAFIGDMIMPGLGTVGGVALGYLGGKDFGRHRRARKEERAIAQEEWEAKYGHDRRHRDRSHDHSSRGSSDYQGNRSRQRSYERRKDDY